MRLNIRCDGKSLKKIGFLDGTNEERLLYRAGIEIDHHLRR
jgi:hypothetical protein